MYAGGGEDHIAKTLIDTSHFSTNFPLWTSQLVLRKNSRSWECEKSLNFLVMCLPGRNGEQFSGFDKIRICVNVFFVGGKFKKRERHNIISFSQNGLFNAEDVQGDLWEPTFPSLLGFISYNRRHTFRPEKKTCFSMGFLGPKADCLPGRLILHAFHILTNDEFWRSTFEKSSPKTGCIFGDSKKPWKPTVIGDSYCNEHNERDSQYY